MHLMGQFGYTPLYFALSLNQLAHYPGPAALEDVSTQSVSHLAHLLTKMMALGSSHLQNRIQK